MKIEIVGHATSKKIIGRRLEIRHYSNMGWRGFSVKEVEKINLLQSEIPEKDTVFYRIQAPIIAINSRVMFAGEQVHNLEDLMKQVMDQTVPIVDGEINAYCYIIGQRINVFPTYEKLEEDIKKRKWEIKTNDFKMKMKLLKSKKEEESGKNKP